METSVEFYIWLYQGCLPKCKKCIPQLEYGHAAMLIPWHPIAQTDKPYPLYVSFHNTAKFVEKDVDRAKWESKKRNCHCHQVTLPCTPEQIAKMWQRVLAMKNPERADEKNFTESQGYYIPYGFGKEEIYNITFNLYENRESNSGEYNCTTLIFKLLEDANVTLPSYPGSNKGRGVATGILQFLSSAAAGYNLGVAIEICEACLPEETKHIKKGAFVSIGFLVLALVTDCCCLPYICESGNCVSDAVIKRFPLPPSILKSLSLPMLTANLIILIYIAIIHGQYHAFFDNESVILPLVGGILFGIIYCAFSWSRNRHLDAHTYVTKPEALLELLVKKKEETPAQINDLDQVVELDDLSQEETVHRTNQWGSVFKPANVKPASVPVKLNTQGNPLDDDTGKENSNDDLSEAQLRI